MASNIVLPDLPTWVQRRITTLYSAKSADDFGGAFDAFVSENAKITVNGKSVSRDEYKKMIQGEIIADAGAEVTFNGLVSVPSEDKDLRAIGTGTVGIFFKAVVFGKFFVFGAPESNTVNSSMNVVVTQDPSLHHHQIGRGGAFDGRRVSVLDEVLTDEPNKIIPPVLPPTTSTATS